MKKFSKLTVSALLVLSIAALPIVSVSAQIDQAAKGKLELFAQKLSTTNTTVFNHDYNNSYDKSFFGGIVKGKFSKNTLFSNATANTEINLAIGIDGYATVTLVGVDGINYKNSQFGSDIAWLSSGNANAGSQACYATSHNSSRTIRNSGDYYGYVAQSSTY